MDRRKTDEGGSGGQEIGGNSETGSGRTSQPLWEWAALSSALSLPPVTAKSIRIIWPRLHCTAVSLPTVLFPVLSVTMVSQGLEADDPPDMSSEGQ